VLGLSEAFLSEAGNRTGAAVRGGALSPADDAALRDRLLTKISALTQLGVDPKQFLSLAVSGRPPQLPHPHFSRAAVFSDIARLFDTGRIAAIADYSESGKSTTVAEYVTHLQDQVFWFGVPTGGDSDFDWLAIFSLSLSVRLGFPVLSAGELATVLAEHGGSLLIVLDDAHNVNALSSLDSLFRSIRSNKNISLLLVGVDTPEFKSAVRAKGIETLRIPGLTNDECRELLGISGETPALQSFALESLRSRCGGHFGLVRLGWSDIQNLQTKNELIQYLADLPEGGGIGLESVQSALVSRLRKGLTDEETLLCRRLSLASVSFRRCVGESLWSHDRDFADFSLVWGSCVQKVFEGGDSGRFMIPEVYESGFRREVEPSEKEKLHGSIADGFSQIPNEQMDYLDAHAIVYHRYLSGVVDDAMHVAAMYVTFAAGPGGRQAQVFFLRRFEILFSAVDESLVTSGLLQWNATRLRVYDDLGDSENAGLAAQDVRRIMSRLDDNGASPASQESRQLSWLALLLYAAKHADPDLALESATKIDRPDPEQLPGLPIRWDAFLILSAALPSEKLILPYLEQLILSASAASFESWYQSDAIHAYEFWRVVASRLYQDFYTLSEQDDRDSNTSKIAHLVGVLWEKDVHDIAAIIECSLVRIEIDFYRDFGAAEQRSIKLTEQAREQCDQEVLVHVLQTRADSLRCSDRDNEAILVYEEAISAQPASDWSEEADLHLLLGISQAKSGQWKDARRSADRSASMFQRSDSGDGQQNQLAAAKSSLEGAGFAIHGREYQQATRLLIQTHRMLAENHREHPLWAALAQISWSLVNCIRPESTDPQPPLPGFSFNLQSTDESQAMQRSAVPLMLSRVCDAAGRPHRAIVYSEQAIAESANLENRSSAAFFGIDAALAAKNIVATSKYAVLTSAYLQGRAIPASQQSKAFLLDYTLGRAFRMVVEQLGTPGFDKRLKASIQAVDQESQGTEPEILFRDCLVSLLAATTSKDWSDLDSVFRSCERLQAGWLAKEIAWVACYRCNPSEMSEVDFLKWHYRVVRWSGIVGENDPIYATSVFEQQRDYWSRIPADGRSQRVQKVVAALESGTEDVDGLMRVAKVLGHEHAAVSSLQEAIDELTTQITMPHGPTIAESALDQISLRLLDLCLSPLATHHANDFVPKIELVSSLIGAVGADDFRKSEFSNLLDLGNALKGAEIGQGSFAAVRRVVDLAESMTADSAAQGFVYLRHWLQFSPDDFGYVEIATELAKPRVRRIIDDPELSDFMKIRLSVSHHVSIAFFAQQRLSKVLARIGTQVQGRAPVLEDAILQAESERVSQLETLRGVISDLERLATEARISGFSIEEWNALFELGCVLQLLGVTLVRFTGDQSAIDQYLREAIRAFRQAVEAIKELDGEQDAEMLAKAAFSARPLCREVNDQVSLRYFEAVIERIRLNGGFGEAIARQEQAESQSIVNMLSDRSESRIDQLSDEEFEEYVQHAVDHSMESMGWPEDRREFVERDIRKLRVYEQEKARYCKHLIPLQDLVHTHHPATVYAEETNYTIGCALLRIRTNIGVTDMQFAIETMKLTHCKNCEHREPGEPAS